MGTPAFLAHQWLVNVLCQPLRRQAPRNPRKIPHRPLTVVIPHPTGFNRGTRKSVLHDRIALRDRIARAGPLSLSGQIGIENAVAQRFNAVTFAIIGTASPFQPSIAPQNRRISVERTSTTNIAIVMVRDWDGGLESQNSLRPWDSVVPEDIYQGDFWPMNPQVRKKTKRGRLRTPATVEPNPLLAAPHSTSRSLTSLWHNDRGFVVSAELVMVATSIVVGLLVGLSSVRDAVVSELSDVGGSIQDVNQSYSLDGVVAHNANTAGFDYIDNTDECDNNDQIAGQADNCITFDGPGGDGEFEEGSPLDSLGFPRNGEQTFPNPTGPGPDPPPDPGP